MSNFNVWISKATVWRGHVDVPVGAEGSKGETGQEMLSEGHQTQSRSWKICGILIHVKSPILWKRLVLQLNKSSDLKQTFFHLLFETLNHRKLGFKQLGKHDMKLSKQLLHNYLNLYLQNSKAFEHYLF